MKDFCVLDIESDGLLNEVTKIHCLSYNIFIDGKSIKQGSITDYSEIKTFLLSQSTLVGHNIVCYDIPVIEKILNIKPKAMLVDTLALSWYLYPSELKNGKEQKRKHHGLEFWGEILGIKKPEVKDWKGLSVEEYINRCEEDVAINTKLWLMMQEYLGKIYNGNYISILQYLTFKMDCAREQEEVMCDINKSDAYKYLDTIMSEIDDKIERLSNAMPKDIKYKTIKKPNIYKKDGSVSVSGERWLKLCDELGVKAQVPKSIDVIKSIGTGNPGSPIQLKNWLFSIGWEPEFYESRTSNVTGITKEVPQISKDGKICPDIKRLIEDYPALEELKGLTILTHRKGVFESFINACDKNNKIVASIGGLTNTLRFQHRKPVANLVKVGKPWGKEIRGLITVPDDSYVLCGSDMSSLEDTTKQHYMYFFDPEYVIQMRVPGFDPHTDVAVSAKLMTKEEEQLFKDLKYRDEELKETLSDTDKQEYFRLSKIRSNAKTVNFSAIYGASPAKIAKTLKCDLNFAQGLHTAYWERNKAVKLVANEAIVKTVNNQMWLYNPVSKFWYTLRYEKDKFSTLNQGKLCSV